MEKRCSICNEVKAKSEFWGTRSECKICARMKDRSRAYKEGRRIKETGEKECDEVDITDVEKMCERLLLKKTLLDRYTLPDNFIYKAY